MKRPWARNVALLSLGLASLTNIAWPVGARAQDDTCRHWRAVFTAMPKSSLVVDAGGRPTTLRVKMADTPERQAGGFQCATRSEIDRTVILFDFGQEILTQFHMRHVPAPLDIAFAKADGRIFAILRMDPSDTTLYGPMGSFRYAIEARAGFFAAQGIRQGEARLVMPAQP